MSQCIRETSIGGIQWRGTCLVGYKKKENHNSKIVWKRRFFVLIVYAIKSHGRAIEIPQKA
jgi:hypothetical protein